MYYFVLVACLTGVYFTSSGASLTVDNGMMLGLKFNESMMVKEHKDKDIIDQYVISKMEPIIGSITHTEHKTVSDEETEDSEIKPGTFSVKSFLNLFSEDIDNHGPSHLDGKNNQTNTSKVKNKNERHEDIVIDEVDIQMPKETESESQESESNDQQTQGLLKQHGSSPIKLNTENVKPVAEGNTGYENILEEVDDDEDLQYVLNITQNLDTMKQSIHNETHDEHFIEPSLKDVIDIRVLENATNIEEESVDDDNVETFRHGRKIGRKNLNKEENGVKSRIILGDLVIKQEESASREQQNQKSDSTVNNRIRGDVPDLDYTSEMTAVDQNDGNRDKATLNFPRHHKNGSDHHISHHDDDIDISIQKEEGNSKINNMNLSTDPCINFHCKRGKTCKTDGHGNPFCACQDQDYCSPTNRNDLVCGTDNKTYTSACHLFARKCLLEGTKEGSHLHLDYQGPCKYIPPCTEYELMHFPFRMGDWLKNVLMQLYERGDENTGLLSEKQKSKVKKIYENEKRMQEGDHNIELLVRDFQKNYHMYVYPVLWQFHQLDQHSMDRLLTHSELAALRVPLIPIEHCVNAFLQACNTNNDRHISLWEWCRCFGIKEGDINEDLLF